MPVVPREAADSAIPDQWSDLLRLIQRHSAVAMTCIAVCLVLGGLYFLKATKWYESVAEVLIVSKHRSGFGESSGSENPVDEKAIETHVELIRSKLIIGAALKSLGARPAFFDADVDPVQEIKDNLTVNLKTENSAVLEVKYQCPVPDESKRILEAIVSEYELFLEDSAQSVGKETFDLIAQAKDELSKQLAELEKSRNKFRAASPLLWSDGKAVNLHHERQNQIEGMRRGLIVERSTLAAKIEALESAVARGAVSREALYYEAVREMALDQEDPDLKALEIAEQEQFAEREAMRQSASLLMQEFVRLKVRQNELVDEFGDGHPEVTAAASRTEEVRQMLLSVIENRMPFEGFILAESAGRTDDADYVSVYMEQLRNRLNVLDQQLVALDMDFATEQKAANEMVKYQLQDESLDSELGRTKLLFDQVVLKLKEIDLVENYGGDELTVIAAPSDAERVAPRILHVGIISSLLGVVCSCLAAWLLESWQKLFHTVQDIRAVLGVPVIGRIPRMPPTSSTEPREHPEFAAAVYTVHQDRSAISEAFRSIRTNLYFSGGTRQRVLQVTSASPGDGKSTIAVNLAVTIARSGKSVVLVDADFRRPNLDQLVQVPPGATMGFANVISGKATLDEAVVKTSVENLYFLPTLARPKNPSEMLTTSRFEEVLEELRARFDFVVLDTPPVLAVTDPCTVAARVDGVVLAVRIRRGVQLTARRALETLESVQAKVLGVIVNGVEEQWGNEPSSFRYGYGHEYASYASETADRPNGRSRIAMQEVKSN